MSQRVDIFEIREPWKGSIGASIAFHATILGLILAYGAWIGFSRNQWGAGNGVGDAISVTLAAPSAIPLPRDRQTDNIVAHESPAVGQSVAKEIPKPVLNAVPIPETTKIKPREKAHETPERRPQPGVTPQNQVQYGERGQISQSFSTTSNAVSVGAASLTVGGDFGSRYAFYVRQIAQILSQNWLQYEVDPHAMPNATVSVTFDISRSGQPSNVRISQSSGIPVLDTSAVRTLQRIDTFGPLPGDYRGSSVTVESQFHYTPMKK